MGRAGPLGIIVYDPETSFSHTVLLSKTERMNLGFDKRDSRLWRKSLIRRIRLRDMEANDQCGRRSDRTHHLPRPMTRKIIIDKTIVSTACKLPRAGVGIIFFRVRASLLDDGYLALDLYNNETSEQCRFTLSANELAPTILALRPTGWEGSLASSPGGGQACEADANNAMQCMLASLEWRRNTVYGLVRDLSLDGGKVLLIQNSARRTATIIVSDISRLRRPQSGLPMVSSARSCCRELDASRCYSSEEHFLKYRRQFLGNAWKIYRPRSLSRYHDALDMVSDCKCR